MVKLNLTSKKLLDKKFKTARNGYDPLEVDIYLDKILSDYKAIESNEVLPKGEVDSLRKKIDDLEESIKKLEIENTSFKTRLSNIKDGEFVTTENVNLIKRINSLEKFIFEKGFDPSKIK